MQELEAHSHVKRSSKSNQLLKLIANPPPGSKIEAAIKHGVDLTLNVRLLELTPTERVREMEGVLRVIEALRNAERIDTT